jgi:hypothetical protein
VDYKTLRDKFIKRDKDALGEFNHPHNWGINHNIESRLAFAEARLLDLCETTMQLLTMLEEEREANKKTN